MGYGESLYGTLLYSGNPVIDRPEQVDSVDLMHYLPEYYRGVREMEELQSTLGMELKSLKTSLIENMDQSFLETATWGLHNWEFELGLTTDPTKSYIRRREMIKAKMLGSGTTTPQMIQRTASAFSGGDVDVKELPGQYLFEVHFVGVKGIPANMAGLIQVLDDIKPAHLGYEFKYTYTWWESLKTLTWGQAKAKTWGDLRVHEGG
ncbi:YmfQ family protein [Paenibacillus sp. SC116]|uniref:YmfQ family protein n=1 Tax=Paenibacillus sp. SC116 TaxID=2968986 RepID=UPI00215A4946|nr:YmfQ family protein [Paenibacillus sp. SC116]MCR8844045.1 YmfQ family protein [Paenibacillus sp. SC116]